MSHPSKYQMSISRSMILRILTSYTLRTFASRHPGEELRQLTISELVAGERDECPIVAPHPTELLPGFTIIHQDPEGVYIPGMSGDVLPWRIPLSDLAVRARAVLPPWLVGPDAWH